MMQRHQTNIACIDLQRHTAQGGQSVASMRKTELHDTN